MSIISDPPQSIVLDPSLGKARFKQGSYTGDGATTQAITGLGFKPTGVIVYQMVDGVAVRGWFKTTGDGANSLGFGAGELNKYGGGMIISFDSDGFTVGSTGAYNSNALNRPYGFYAWRED